MRFVRGKSLGFTLIELLIVIAIIGVLIALLLPAISAAREAARRTQCKNNLKQAGTAIVSHEAARRSYPIGCIGCRFNQSSPGQPFVPQRFLSWNIQILPYIEEAALHSQFNYDVPSYQSPNKETGAKTLAVFICPSTPSDKIVNSTGLWKGLAFTDYGGIYGVEGPGRNNTDPTSIHWLNANYLGVMLYEEASRTKDISDGTSKTALVGEMLLRRVTESEWANGHNLFAQEGSNGINQRSGLGNEIGSPHPGGASVIFCDGHVEFLADGIQQSALNALLTRAGSDDSSH